MAAFSRADEVREVELVLPGAVEVNSRELVKVVGARRAATTTMILVEDVGGLVAADDLGGRITTSHNATAMLQLTSSRTGSCWRKLISTAWLS